jgi:hypothetical protein
MQLQRATSCGMVAGTRGARMRDEDRLRAGFIAILGLAACGEPAVATSPGTPDSGIRDGAISACPVEVRDEDCDKSQRPIVFVHGTYGSGDNIANVALLFGSNGFCQDRFLAVEYNSLGGTPQDKLDGIIDKVLAETGRDRVELMGHSQGTKHCYDYLADPVHAPKSRIMCTSPAGHVQRRPSVYRRSAFLRTATRWSPPRV